MAGRAGIHLIVGACLEIEGNWRNASFYFGPKGERRRYDKINLARSGAGRLHSRKPTAGVWTCGLATGTCASVSRWCREIRYPEQWQLLARQGAEIVAYVNNAIGNPEGPDLWRAHVISRAAENQRFVIGANNAAFDQGCTSLIVAPSGKVLAEADIGATACAAADIDLADVSDWTLDQARTDVVSVEAR